MVSKLTIADANSNVLAQTTAYIQIVDIKQMYERWTVGDQLSVAPTNEASLATEGLPVGASAFQYAPPQDTNTPYVLFVHGWNLESWDKDRFAETAFKRLYWQGYQGRFGLFRWPTGNGITGTLSAIYQHKNYDDSEYNAWQSGRGLLNKLNDLNMEYPGQVYLMAHSMGNVVAGEALRLAGSNQVVNTYIALQGAVPAHCYDSTTPDYATYSPPDCYADYWTNGAPCYFSGSAGAGTHVNFFNTNDYALNKWLTDQSFKPDVGYQYDYVTGDFSQIVYLIANILYFPTNTYQIFSYADPAWSYALGAQPNVGGVFDDNQVNLPSVWQPDPTGKDYSEHFWHSAEFRTDNPSMWQFWNEALLKLNLKQPQP